MAASSEYTSAEDWMHRFKAAGGRIKVNGISMRLHPNCRVSERCRDLWSEIRGVDHLDRWQEIETRIRLQVGELERMAHQRKGLQPTFNDAASFIHSSIDAGRSATARA